jgi:hypothetical protein
MVSMPIADDLNRQHHCTKPLQHADVCIACHVHACLYHDSRAQLQTFKDAVASLKDGNSLVTFAEGTRSKDGRLRSFKKVSACVTVCSVT